MVATMIKIERNAQFQAACARCRKAHPLVKNITWTGRFAQCTVIGSKGEGYIVKLSFPRDMTLAQCSCPSRTLCYHAIAALSAVTIPEPETSNAGVMVKRERGGKQIDGWWV